MLSSHIISFPCLLNQFLLFLLGSLLLSGNAFYWSIYMYIVQYHREIYPLLLTRSLATFRFSFQFVFFSLKPKPLFGGLSMWATRNYPKQLQMFQLVNFDQMKVGFKTKIPKFKLGLVYVCPKCSGMVDTFKSRLGRFVSFA